MKKEQNKENGYLMKRRNKPKEKVRKTITNIGKPKVERKY